MTVEIRALERTDDRQAFHSGDEALDLYFYKYAGQNPFRHHVGVTYVVVEGGRVLGFVTVSPGSLDAGDLPSGRRAPPYPVPILRVARFAVDESARELGLGKALLRFAGIRKLAEKMMTELGCVGMVLDAKKGGGRIPRAVWVRAIGCARRNDCTTTRADPDVSRTRFCPETKMKVVSLEG